MVTVDDHTGPNNTDPGDAADFQANTLTAGDGYDFNSAETLMAIGADPETAAIQVQAQRFRATARFDSFTQDELRAELHKIAIHAPDSLSRAEASTLPSKLDTNIQENAEVLIRLLLDNTASISGTFEANACLSLRKSSDPRVPELLLAKVFGSEGNYEVGGAAAIALRSIMTPEIAKQLKPLIEGGEIKSELAIADIHNEGIFEKLSRVWRVMSTKMLGGGFEIREMRVRAAVALFDAEPEQAKAIIAKEEHCKSAILYLELINLKSSLN